MEEKNGSFQILVNNSGIRKDSVVGMMKEEDWRDVIDANLTGTFLMSKLAVHHLMRQRYGRIITITSPIGRMGFAGQSNYAASKAAQVAFTQSLAKEVASRGITANCISPGFIETDMTDKLNDAQKEQISKNIPVNKMGKAEDIAYAVSFLASDKASYITGETINVNGGLFMP